MQTVERWVTRSDAWTPDDDEKLASLVLHHIRTGSTQLRAFEDSANELGRTAAACGYRWNGVVRKNYREQIELAKKERKNAQKAGFGEVQQATNPLIQDTTPMTSSDSMKDVVKFLETFDSQYQRLRFQVEKLEAERQQLLSRIEELEGKTIIEEVAAPVQEEPEITPEQLQEDSKTLFAIMERARKLLEGDGRTRSE